MKKQKITVLLNDRPYHLTLEVEVKGEHTIYRVSEDQDKDKLGDLIPDKLSFDVNGTVHMDERIRTVEGEEIARAIWLAIQEELGKNEPH